MPLDRRSFIVALAALPALGALAASPAPRTILVLGDSISAGYGLPAGAGWVDLLAKRIGGPYADYRVVNASITGDTTAGGRARLPALLKQHRPAVVVVELGGNDGLRGGDLDATRANLDAMVKAAQAAHAKVLIVGARVPPNYGASYAQRFANLFTDVAKARRVPVVPDLFAGFGEDLAQFQSDRIHPVASAEPAIVANVWPTLAPLLSRR